MQITKFMLAGTLGLFVALAGCRSTQEVLKIGEAADANPGPCPRAFSLHDAQRFVEFKGDGRQTFSNVGFTGEIGNIRSLCRYYGEQPIRADLELQMDFGRGPAAEAASYTYQYWVAVTRKNIAVINKQTFPVTVTFPAGSDRVSLVENINEIIIPRASENTSGENFEIIVGFEVDAEQRAFNAEGRRFRVSAGQN